MATSRLIKRHVDKGRSILASIAQSIDYGMNPNKTRDGDLISAYECDPRTAALEFVLAKKQYAAITGREQPPEKDVLLYQIRQAFPKGEITPEDANRIAHELAMRFTKGKHAFIVCTHEDKEHIHSHIYFNSTTLDCDRKFVDFPFSAFALRRMNDYLCVENGLSIIKNPKPGKGKHYGAWLGDRRQPSFQQRITRRFSRRSYQRSNTAKQICVFPPAKCGLLRQVVSPLSVCPPLESLAPLHSH